jgi:hypothetical protein
MGLPMTLLPLGWRVKYGCISELLGLKSLRVLRTWYCVTRFMMVLSICGRAAAAAAAAARRRLAGWL